MSSLFFSSVLRSEYRNDLEALMFFNPQQVKVKSAIIECIEKYGTPKIVINGELLRISVGEFTDVQSLFAFDQLDLEGATRLIGLVVYVRLDIENILVLHMAVLEEYSASGSRAEEMLVMKLIVKLREIASRIKGLNSVSFVYEKGITKKIRS